jgi:hypothetical protein
MGKARREAKLERRNTQQAITEDQKFNWKKLLRRMALIAPRVLLVVFGMLIVQIVGAALGIKFLSTSIGQLVIFGVFYVALFRWIYAPMLAEQKAMRDLESRSASARK